MIPVHFRPALAGAAVAVALLMEPAGAADAPALRASVSVDGPLVTLGDLIENSGAVGDVAVFRAPDPGTSGRVSAARIIAAAREHGLAGVMADGLDTVSVSRTSRVIRGEEIERRVAAALEEAGTIDAPEHVRIRLEAIADTHIESAATEALAVKRFDYDARTGRFAAVLTVPDSRLVAAGIRVAGYAEPVVELPVLIRTVSRGEIISAGDIAMERVARRAVDDDSILSADGLIGRAARRALMPGSPIRQGSVMEPILVSRNEPVTIVYRIPGLTLTARGRAIAEGARGDLISVINDQSRRTVEAEVTGPGEVMVLPANPPLAALAEAS